MKTKTSLRTLFCTAALASVVFALPAVAATPAQLPVPVKVVEPTDLPRGFTEATVTLTFTIDASGNVRDIAPAARIDRKLAARVLPAVAQWKFTPMLEDGRPVPVRVVFPLRVTARA